MTHIDKAEALLPCPFCDDAQSARVMWVDWSFRVVCLPPLPERLNDLSERGGKDWPDTGCGAQGEGCATEAEAIAAWNRRAALPARGVGVKPLVWFEAELPSRGGGKYTADGYTLRRIEGLWLLDFAGNGKTAWRWVDLEAAKAAAQADYEARILAALAPTDAAQARETHLREAAAAVRARYMGDNNREDQEVLRCEAAILALIDKPASAAQAREAALHDRITEALVAAQERAHRAYEQDAPFDPNEHKVRISVKDTYAILALIGEPRP